MYRFKVHYRNDSYSGYTGHLCGVQQMELQFAQKGKNQNLFACCTRVKKKVTCGNCKRILKSR